MDSYWLFLILFLGLNAVGSYLFAPPEKKREAGAQALTQLIAQLCGILVMYFAIEKLLTTPEPGFFTLPLSVLLGGIVWLSVGALTWKLFQGYLQKKP